VCFGVAQPDSWLDWVANTSLNPFGRAEEKAHTQTPKLEQRVYLHRIQPLNTPPAKKYRSAGTIAIRDLMSSDLNLKIKLLY